MDIENMHPFCLPFSLCHDATGSSISDVSCQDIKLTSSNNNHYSRTKSKEALSPLDDLFDQLDANQSPQSHNNRSLLSDECLIDDHDNDDQFHSLHLDIDMQSSSDELDSRSHEFNGLRDDEWFAGSTSPTSGAHDCLLFSPLAADNSLRQRKLLKPNNHPYHHQYHYQQLFHHAVDPLEIKSSPTLAQLNLNSTDDPTDGLWETQNSTRTHNTTFNSNSSAATLTNSTLITPQTPTTTRLSSDLATSCLIGNQQQHAHLNNMTTCNQQAAYSTPAIANLLPMCHHHHHHQASIFNQQHNNHQTTMTNNGSAIQRAAIPSHIQDSCLAVGPLRTSFDQQRNPQAAACCFHHRSPISTYHQAAQCTMRQNQLGEIGTKSCDNQEARMRCLSPAPLVTSSSSPLSSTGNVQNNNLPNETRLSDNKLKENIEYLTVLLCNGNNKLDNNIKHPCPQQPQQHQHPSISSTIVKPYSTLAQSLSTGPKLLEKYHPQQHQTSNNNNNAIQAQNYNNCQPPSNNHPRQNNEASSHCVVQIGYQNHQQQLQLQQRSLSPLLSHDGLKRGPSDQWFKPNTTVESSISAADSTAENQLPSSLGQPSLNRCPTYAHNLNLSTDSTSNNSINSSRQSEMKVLSSLLNSSSSTPSTFINGLQANGGVWQGDIHQNVTTSSHQQATSMQQQQQQAFSPYQQAYKTSQEVSSVPPNGTPITLTPLVSNNVILPKRQPQKVNKSAKVATFVQPASPSASSTTSSSGGNSNCIETTNSLSTNAVVPSPKRQKPNHLSPQSKTTTGPASDRSARPNSLSTDCSLSSHDEGFSSQIDQDDCLRDDSDDESEVDSDDESFYGDYTNNDLIGASISDNPDCKWTLSMGRTRRNGQRRFFWQYNVQSKGPKGTRIASADSSENPFVLPEASDPVFSNDCQIEGVKHSGKARRGDGNDLTPNPKKLLMIGLELKKLSKIINELAPVTDLPVNARNKTRKEKNKLASRACRLKKKAQHEANKIKLYGLQREHQQVVMAIYDIRKMLRETLATTAPQQPVKDKNMSSIVRTIIEQCSISVAGTTSDYVNSVLEKVVSGFIDGGLTT